MSAPPSRISICVCTYRRPHLLHRLLEAVGHLRTDGLFTYSVVVVDNDELRSASEVVDRAKSRSAVSMVYDAEPERSISLARNRSVRLADGDLLAFIDDDEFPEETWLLNHVKTMRSSNADGVLGPVLPHFDAHAPSWLIKSGLCERPRFKTGAIIGDFHHTRTGNALVRRTLFTDFGGSFDPKYGRSGGGDAVFFKEMMEKDRLFVWCDEARVYEAIPPERQTRAYYIKRAFTRGMTEAWVTRLLSAGTLRSLLAIVLYGTALPFLLLLGHHHFMRFAVKTCDHLGKILGHLGVDVVRERPYGTAAL
jgi:succinoglycan biosynthesis protein ExoM